MANLSHRAQQTPEPPDPVFGYRFGGSIDVFTYEDDRLRPTWKFKRGYRFTAEHRRQLCVHLAAHAAVSGIGGAWVYMLAVAQAGVRSWTIRERKSADPGGMFGICCTSDIYSKFLTWDDHQQKYEADRDAWERELEREHAANTRLDASRNNRAVGSSPEIDVVPLPELIRLRRRVVRAQVCGYLAGHIADGITAGMTATEALRLYDRRKDQYVGNASDIVTAEGLAGLLPPGEYEHAIRVTEEVLRRPEVWDSVNQVAEALGQYGLLEGAACEVDIFELLPQRDDAEWPHALV